MKVSFPLSLKVTLWLLLNLLLLGAAAIAFLIAQGGLSLDSLVAGSPGQRLHLMAAAIADEAANADDNGEAVLSRFGNAYHAEIVLVRNRGSHLTGATDSIPDDVRHRIDEGPPMPFRGPNLSPEELGGPQHAADVGPGHAAARHPNPRGRFLVHTTNPTRWWLGFRVPFPDANGRLIPATLLIRVNSLWGLIILLNFETWLLVAASILVLSVLFWLPLVRSITRQLRVLSTATERIAEGRFETRVPGRRRDELGRLGESVNAMAARLDTLVNGQRRFLGDIAHELGSPIARLQIATEILENRADPALRPQIADVREEVQQMTDLVNELLAFTKAGMRPRDATLGAVNLDVLFLKVLARDDHGQRVQLNATPGLQVEGDEPLLVRAIGNLVRNALRYAADSKTISLTASRENDTIVLAVEDEGPGVPAAALERLGEPFFRPEFARTRETGGIGLGLAIVRSSVGACGGQVRFSNRMPRGFRAEIRLKSA